MSSATYVLAAVGVSQTGQTCLVNPLLRIISRASLPLEALYMAVRARPKARSILLSRVSGLSLRMGRCSPLLCFEGGSFLGGSSSCSGAFSISSGETGERGEMRRAPLHFFTLLSQGDLTRFNSPSSFFSPSPSSAFSPPPSSVFSPSSGFFASSSPPSPSGCCSCCKANSSSSTRLHKYAFTNTPSQIQTRTHTQTQLTHRLSCRFDCSWLLLCLLFNLGLGGGVSLLSTSI